MTDKRRAFEQYLRKLRAQRPEVVAVKQPDPEVRRGYRDVRVIVGQTDREEQSK